MAGLIADALRALEIDNFVLQIHSASFPADPSDDVGRGSPYSRGGRRFAEWARGLGFTGLLLGPMGEPSPGNPSPYDATAFSRNPLDVSLAELRDGGLISDGTVAALASGAPSHVRADDGYASVAVERALDEAFAGFRDQPALDGFRRAHAGWLPENARYAWLTLRFGHGDFRRWPSADPPPAEFEARYAFAQFVVHRQHADFKRTLGMDLFGDLHIGLSMADQFARQGLFLSGYALGAPPSRTNPDGQPWGYPVPDPSNPAATALVVARLEKLFSEFDGVRIDHPHGLVCPWVYRTDLPDPLAAVQTGARLFESPDLPDHPNLARFAITRPDQLDRSRPRHADDWVRELDEAQVVRYAALIDTIVETAKSHGRSAHDLICEVLSTCPYPLARVMQRHGLGRFRVTQKVDLDDPRDVYRTENAEPQDWVMVGTHDTPPLWRVVDQWRERGIAERHAAYLSQRLGRPVSADPASLAQAKLADLFTSRARNVLVFFNDLLGGREVYNAPGTVDALNWTLRVPPDFAARPPAFDISRALADALDAKRRAPELAAALRAASGLQ